MNIGDRKLFSSKSTGSQGPINILGRVTIIGSFHVAVLNVGDLKMAKIAANRAESCVLPSRQFEIDQYKYWVHSRHGNYYWVF